MFVVAIIGSYYNSDDGHDDQYTLDPLFETTEGAEKHIKKMAFDKKKAQFVAAREHAIRDQHHQLFCDDNGPQPSHPNYNEKPPFNHSRAHEKGYQKFHEEEINHWRANIYRPQQALYNEWEQRCTAYINANSPRDIEDFHRFLNAGALDHMIELVTVDEYNEVKYTTKIMEVFK